MERRRHCGTGKCRRNGTLSDCSLAGRCPQYPFKGGRLRLRTDVHCDRFEGMPIREVSFRQYDWLDYIPELHASPEDLKQEFGHIEKFLALLTGTYYYLDWPQISNGEGDKFESFTLYFERFLEKMEPLEVTQLWTTFPQVEKQFGALYERQEECA